MSSSVRRYQFPLLADLIPIIADKLDQPLDEPGQLSWTNPAEFALACNAAVRWVFREGSDLDINLNIVEDDVSVVAGDQHVYLPLDLRALRKAYWVSGSGSFTEELRVGRWEYDQRGWRSDAIFLPRRMSADKNLDGRPALRFTRTPHSTRTLHVIYDSSIVRLAHGCVQSYGASPTESIIVLQEHEPRDTGALQAQRFWFPQGIGAGQDEVATSYDGPTQTIRTALLGTALDDTTIYTTRPPLHADCEDTFIYDVCSRLSEKYDESMTMNFKMERDRCLATLRDSLVRLDRQEPLTTRDDSGMSGGDPLLSNYGYGGW